MPPVPDLHAALERILAPFDENGKDEDGDENRHGFWDWWVVGGRWSGTKVECDLDTGRKEAFFATLAERKFTVSGLKAGKDRLDPPDQAEVVDALWRESFPDSPLKSCPFFAHFNDQHKDTEGFPDVMRLEDSPRSLTASRVIVAGPTWNDDAKLEARYMIQDSCWNGVTHVDCKWDGSVRSALEAYKQYLGGMNPDYAAKQTPREDWLSVTVDYHS